MRVGRIIAQIALLILAAGCGAGYRYDPAAWSQTFNAPSPGRFQAREVRSQNGVRLVGFPSTYRSPVLRNNTVWGELYARRNPDAGAVVFLPGLGGGLLFERTLAVALAKRGYAVYLMYLPYTHLRAAEGSGTDTPAEVLSTDMERNEALVVQTVRDARRAAVMLERRYPHLRGRVGIMGTSLGGVLSAITFSSDDTFRAAVLCLAGGRIAESLLSSSPLTAKLRRKLLQEGYDLPRLRHALRKMEPTHYARPGKARQVLLIGATQDSAVPRESVRALARAFGGGRIFWLKGNHLQAATKLISRLGLMDAHLRLRLQPPQGPP